MKTLPDLPDFRSNHDSNLLNGEPTVCGGDLTLKSCLRLNIHNNAWEGSFETRGLLSHNERESLLTTEVCRLQEQAHDGFLR